jgi:membrane protease subunit HflK
MAWNEPGNSGGKDPWGGGGRKNEQGPPDLDEVVRNLQGKLNGLFGGGDKGNTGGGSVGGGMGAGSFGAILVIAILVWALSGIYIIDEGNRGVVTTFGKYTDTTMPGPHWHARFVQSVEKVNVSGVRSIELGLRPEESLMLTQDENIVDVKFAVQYQVGNARDYLFNARNPDETIRQVMESAVREIVGKSEMDFVITGGRSEVVNRAQELMQRTLDVYGTGLVISQLTMQNAQAPRQVQGAFADAVKAREDEIRLRNEAEAYANDLIPRARGGAARIIEESNAYREQVIAEAEGETARFVSILAEYRKAPEVTRKRLYIDAMESVLSSSSKILVDTDGSNNLLYLPLDKMMQRSAPADTVGSSSSRGNPSSTETSRQAPSPIRDNSRAIREIR